MRLIEENNKSIPIDNLQVGQVAIVTDWPNNADVLDKIAIRHSTALILLGKDHTDNYPGYFRATAVKSEKRRCRILEAGTILKI